MQSRYRVVVVGCGGISGAWMPTVTQLADLEIVGLVDMRAEAAQALAEKYHLPRELVYATLTEAIAKAKPDLVFDLTVPAAHEGVAMEAIAAGCHVLGEKPMSDDLGKAQRMVAAAKQAGRVYAVIQNRRYEPNIRSVRATVESGEIGELAELHSDFYIGAHFGGFREAMDDVLIVDMSIHTFDAARYLSGADPVSVYCESWNPKHSWYRGDVSAACIFEMTGGIRYTYRGSWCSEGMHTAWEGAWRLVGSRGSLLWDGSAAIRGQRLKAGGKPGFFSEMEDVPVQRVSMEYTAHAAQIREYVECLRTLRLPMTHCQDNIRSFAMVIAAVKSRRLGQRVAVEW